MSKDIALKNLQYILVLSAYGVVTRCKITCYHISQEKP